MKRSIFLFLTAAAAGVFSGEKVMSTIGSLSAQNAQGFVICAPDIKLGPGFVDKEKADAWLRKSRAVAGI
jgi:hypothetical protein